MFQLIFRKTNYTLAGISSQDLLIWSTVHLSLDYSDWQKLAGHSNQSYLKDTHDKSLCPKSIEILKVLVNWVIWKFANLFPNQSSDWIALLKFFITVGQFIYSIVKGLILDVDGHFLQQLTSATETWGRRLSPIKLALTVVAEIVHILLSQGLSYLKLCKKSLL